MTVLVRDCVCVLLLAFCALGCVGQEPLGVEAPTADGGETDSSTLYQPCSGLAGERGSCAESEICGSLPEVHYNYCLPAVPCPEGRVSVIGLACAYPCADDEDCEQYGFARCANNALRDLSDAGPVGWCAPRRSW
jgi:hypothetical protein